MIPVSKPAIGPAEIEAVRDVVASGWLTQGLQVEAFERAWAKFVGAQHAVACSSGTTALHLALVAAGVRPGDEVIVPSLTYVATAAAVRHAGATPVFVDSLPDGTIDPELVGLAAKRGPRAVIAVHLYGQVAQLEALRAICERRDMVLVEDACEAHGASGVGGGDAAVYSFFGNKVITTGEGGMITTDSPDLAARLRHLRSHAQDPARRFWHDDVGYNYRLTEMQAALGLAQLARFDEFSAARRETVFWYRRAGLRVLPDPSPRAPWLTVVELGRQDTDAVAARLSERGIETRPIFPLVHRMQPYASCDWWTRNAVADAWRATKLCLPLWPGMSQVDVERIADGVKERALRKGH